MFILFMIVYGFSIGNYLFSAEELTVPPEYQGGPADPATYMTEEQREQALAYSRTKDVVFFLGTPYEWAVYLIILEFGFSYRMQAFAERWGGNPLRRRYAYAAPTLKETAIYVFLFLLVVELLQFPLRYYVFQLQHEYGISTQSLPSWLGDVGKDWIVTLIMTIPVVWLLYKMMAWRPRRWWVWFWVLTIPLMVFLYYIQPLVIDPLFNKFQPLQDEALKRDILALAERADIPAEQVYEVDMSTKTNAMNAYVTGIGGGTRIVLWDTTLNKMERDEVLFVMAHEMGHYVYRHVQWMMLGSIAVMLGMAYVVYRMLGRIVERWGGYWGIERQGSLASLPLILLLVSILSFALSPVENAVSRQAEHAADRYGMEMMGDADAATGAFQKLAVSGLVEPDPPLLVKVFRYTHPTLLERITFFQEFDD